MRIVRETDAAARVVVLKVSGEVGDRELMEIPDELEQAPEVERDFSVLIDLSHAEVRRVTSAGIQELVHRPLVLSPESRRAFVVPSQLGFGLARMYELLSGETGGSIHVFRDYDDAERWVRTGVL